MPEVKLTKSELRLQQIRLTQLQKYLPTLQLKKAMLQAEIQQARSELIQCEEFFRQAYDKAASFAALLVDASINLEETVKIARLHKRYENIAGVEVPYLDTIVFAEIHYSLIDTPVWLDSAIAGLRKVREAGARVKVAREKKSALEKEFREVSIRVNLFEKILIPRAAGHIRKIKVFLSDQQLAAVSQAKAAKRKIEENKLSHAL